MQPADNGGGNFIENTMDFSRVSDNTHHQIAEFRWTVRAASGAWKRGGPVVRSAVPGQHADVVSESTLRLCIVLSARRVSARDQYGDHFQIVAGLPRDPGARIAVVYPHPGHHYLAAASGLWAWLMRQPQQRGHRHGYYDVV